MILLDINNTNQSTPIGQQCMCVCVCVCVCSIERCHNSSTQKMPGDAVSRNNDYTLTVLVADRYL